MPALHLSEQYKTCSQFFAQALRQVISRPQVLQGLLGRLCLLPLNVGGLLIVKSLVWLKALFTLKPRGTTQGPDQAYA